MICNVFISYLSEILKTKSTIKFKCSNHPLSCTCRVWFSFKNVYKILVNILLISWNVFLQILCTLLVSLARYLQENGHFSCICKINTRFLEVFYKSCIQICVSSVHDLAPSCKTYLEELF